jgi:hypothetical protein
MPRATRRLALRLTFIALASFGISESSCCAACPSSYGKDLNGHSYHQFGGAHSDELARDEEAARLKKLFARPALIFAVTMCAMFVIRITKRPEQSRA